MTIRAFEEPSLTPAQIMRMASVLLLAIALSLMLAIRQHNRILLGLALTFCTAALPAVYVMSKRLVVRLREQETEQRLMVHTKAFLSHQEELFWQHSAVAKEPDPETLGARLLAVLNTDGSALARPGLLPFPPRVAVPEPEPVVFDALPRRYAVRNLFERRLSNGAAAMPAPALMRFGEILPRACPASTICWTAGQRNPRIECEGGVMKEIRMHAAEGYQRMRHGGVEVGGILFGTHSGNLVRIQAMRPIVCDYSNGPRFVLSTAEESALTDSLRASRTDPELAGMEPVGWYRSHTRDDIRLSQGDVAFFNRFFPAAWQVALVLRPANLLPTRAGFFFREAGGGMRTESSYREFQLPPLTVPATRN